MGIHSLHEDRPDLVEKYTAFLEAQFEAHKALGTRFAPGAEVTLTQGACVVQNGTRHRWHNRTDAPATMVSMILGARRP